MKPRTLLAQIVIAVTAAHADPPEPKFRPVDIDTHVQIGYGVAVADVDGDKKTDILLADKKQFAWYRNPGAEKADTASSWQKFVIAENLTAKDNVCLAAQDIDGDGKCEVAVGAEWNPGDTEKSGAVFYLIPPAERTQRWEPVKLHAEPTTHRMRWIPLGEGKWGLVVVPLHGRGNKNGEGAGVRVMLYYPPASLNDAKGEWRTELIDETMHMTHNFGVPTIPADFRGDPARFVLAGREGLVLLRRRDGMWVRRAFISNDGSPDGCRGVGEVRGGHFGNDEFVATVEPMHGNELAVYTKPQSEGAKPDRRVLTNKLVEGHALGCGNVLGVGGDQIVVGWRGNAANPDGKFGVAVWTPLDPEGKQWRETLIDGGMACEDLQLADLNGDGKLDIVASGRATKNLKIYLNER